MIFLINVIYFKFDITLPELLTRKRESENINDTRKIENIPLDIARNECIPNCRVSEACELVGYDSWNNWYHLCVKLKNVPKTKT